METTLVRERSGSIRSSIWLDSTEVKIHVYWLAVSGTPAIGNILMCCQILFADICVAIREISDGHYRFFFT